jgi:hypothetical protein
MAKARCETGEDLLVDVDTRGVERLPRAASQSLVVVVRSADPDDRHVQLAIFLQLIERREETSFGQVAGDSEEDEGVGPFLWSSIARHAPNLT